MTEKRFTFADGFKIVAIKDNGKIMNSRQVCNQLNELHEENQRLEWELEECRNNKLFSRRELEKENKELKKENEQLKHFIQELTTKGTGKIHLANGNIYKVNAILTDFKR